MVVIVISVAVRGPGVEYELKGDPSERWTFVQTGFFEAIGVISFAFVCHHNSRKFIHPCRTYSAHEASTVLIYGSLRTPTLDRFAYVTHISTALSVFACLCMSTSGFLVFTDKTQGNILNNFAQDDTLINIARACVCCVHSFSASSILTRMDTVRSQHVRDITIRSFRMSGSDGNLFLARRGVQPAAACHHHHCPRLGSAFWCALPSQKVEILLTRHLFAVSLITCDLGLILELAGGFSATALAYIFRLSSSPLYPLSQTDNVPFSGSMFPLTHQSKFTTKTRPISSLRLRLFRSVGHGFEYCTLHH